MPAVAERETLVDSLRTQIAEAAPQHADLVIDTLVEAISAKKHVSVTCRKCNTTTRAEVLDAVAATNAIKLLIEQTEGRPGVAADEQASGFQLRRVHVHVNATVGDVHTWLTVLEKLPASEQLDAVLEQMRARVNPVEVSTTEVDQVTG